MQYGRYVERVLHAPSLPRRPPTALRLTRVAMSAWDAPSPRPSLLALDALSFKHVSTSRCVLAVYQRGKQIWSQAASALVRDLVHLIS